MKDILLTKKFKHIIQEVKKELTVTPFIPVVW